MYSEKCNESDKEYIIDKLVAYNLSKVKAEQQELFIDLSRKFVREGKILDAGKFVNRNTNLY